MDQVEATFYSQSQFVCCIDDDRAGGGGKEDTE